VLTGEAAGGWRLEAEETPQPAHSTVSPRQTTVTVTHSPPGIEQAKAERKKLLEGMLKHPPKVQYRSAELRQYSLLPLPAKPVQGIRLWCGKSKPRSKPAAV
jgi:hypothetical protein